VTARVTILVPAALVLLTAVWGCNGPAGKVSAVPPRAVEQVDQIDVYAAPVAVNWDGRPGPDGIDVRVYLYQYARNLPVLVKGALEFAVYEGVVGADDIGRARPFRRWALDAEQLEQFLGRSMVGWGYNIRLPWAPAAAPATSSVTLAARYVPTAGRSVPAAPVTIATESR